LTNEQFLYNYLVERLTNTFPNVNKAITFEKVRNWFNETNQKLFEAEIEDYLVLINRFSVNESADK